MQSSETLNARYPAGLLPSLAVLGAIVAFALIGLAAVGNWPKVLRVAAAAATYALLLLSVCRGRSEPRPGAFLVAGAAAGAVSGLLRPGLLLGPFHWWALRTWQRR